MNRITFSLPAKYKEFPLQRKLSAAGNYPGTGESQQILDLLPF